MATPLNRTKQIEGKDMKWEKNTGEYASGEHLFLGRWKVGGCHFDALRGKQDHNKWLATSRLPGIKRTLGHFSKEEEAKDAVEKATKHWFDCLPSNSDIEGKDNGAT